MKTSWLTSPPSSTLKLAAKLLRLIMVVRGMSEPARRRVVDGSVELTTPERLAVMGLMRTMSRRR